jgi:uncharacterized protein DUF1801
MTRPPAELLEFLRRYPTAVQSLTLGTRKLVHEELAPCHEYIYNMRSTLVLAYSATEKVMADGVCHVTAWARHVNIGFVRGIDLDDPAGLLQGSGKAIRHVVVHSLDDLGRREIRALLRQARLQAGIRRPRGATAHEVVTRVKTKSAAAPFPWPRLP